AISESGIIGTPAQIDVKIDKTAPTVSATLQDEATLSQSKTIIISNLDDKESGIATLEVGVWDSATNEYKYTPIDKTSTTYTAEANGEYVFRATNGAGTSTVTTPITISNIDRENPDLKITATVDDYSYSGQWTNKNVVITVEDTSKARGTTSFAYSTDNGETWKTAGITIVDDKTVSLTISDECKAREYIFKATSQTGITTVSTEKVTVNIDKTAPTGTATLEGNTWSKLVDTVDILDLFYKEPKTGSITAADEGSSVAANSGIAKVYYIVTDSPKTQEQLEAINVWEKDATENMSFIVDDPQGDKIIYVLIKDNAGNVSYISSASKYHIQYDHEPPVITAAPNFTEGAWTSTSEATITVSSITDNVTGFVKDSVAFSYSSDGSYYDSNGESMSRPADVNVVNAGITINDDGSFVIDNSRIPRGNYSITITATDKAGNVGTKVIHVMRTDETGVIISNPSDVTATYGDANATISFTAKAISGVVSYEWQKCESGSDTWTTVGGETFTSEYPTTVNNTYVITNPTVVAYAGDGNNDGDRFRVVVVSHTVDGNVTKTSPEVTLTVNQRQITITPLQQSYRYGTDESIVEVFPAMSDTGTNEGVYWEYYDNLAASRPLDKDADKITFEGQFKRGPGIIPGTYIISSDNEPNNVRLADDATGNNVNGNYYLRIEPVSSSFIITDYDPGVEASLVGSLKEKDGDKWYNGLLFKDNENFYTDGVHIKAPAGYKISWTNNVSDDGWTDYLTVPDGTYNGGKTYYLRNMTDETNEYYRAITVAKTTAPFSQDKVNPEGTITIDSTTWDDILDKLHIKFEIFRSKNVEANITGTDDFSGVDKIQYSVKNAPVDDVTAITDWTTGDSAKVNKADKALEGV
ncbi:MAG: Ig-like domain repeat protein, partial [Clostridia bacterium]|nr:Ig-like domain repeat protein [Clostridia bacterium]